MTKVKMHLHGIDGIRAIMSIAVVVSHTMQAGFTIGLPYVKKGLDIAGFGVTVFFALSGFLITYLLILEKDKKEINILHFYVRRILRIWPLYFFYLLMAFFTSIAFDYIANANQLLFYILFIPNYLNKMIPYTYHYWSLGVEEQFYVFWPWLMKKCKNILAASLIFFVLFMLMKFYARYIEYTTSNDAFYKIMFANRFDCMAIGAIGAILFHSGNTVFLKMSTHIITQLICWSIYIAIFANSYHLISFIDNELVSIATVMIIIAQIAQKNRVINLDFPFMSYLGKISFGIYIYHPLVIFFLFKYLDMNEYNSISRYFLAYGGVISLTILVAHVSYIYLESPFLRYKEVYSSTEK